MTATKDKSDVGSLPLPILNFFSTHYQSINIERLKHLDSLGLNLKNKNVVDLGAGVGDHSLFYLLKGCKVTALEGRSDLVEFIKVRFGINAMVCDFEKELDKLANMKDFDVVHCYGLLYHLGNPDSFLKVVAGVGNTLVIETMVSPSSMGTINEVAEDALNSTQAVSGMGCRPNRKWLYSELKKHYKHVYTPKTQPSHPQFPLDWTSIPENTTHTRVVFVASHTPVQSDALIEEIIDKHSLHG